MGEVTTVGKYKILSNLGRGGMGNVYQAYDPIIGRKVLLKTIQAALFSSDYLDFNYRRFKKEAVAAARLNHFGVVTLYEYGEDADLVFIAMEFVNGKSLHEFFEQGKLFGFKASIVLIIQLLDVLAYAHEQGVVHRDLKPSNIFVQPDGLIKVTDFGITKIEGTDITQVGDILGTPFYMSPEMITGQSVDCRTDFFSTGTILYQLLTGEIPFPGNSLASVMHQILKSEPPPVSVINSQIPPGIDRVISKAMNKTVSQRFQSADEFNEALKKACR